MKYEDIADLDEDERIRKIGHHVVTHKQTVAFVTDSDPGKADRYIEKLMKWFPGQIDVLARLDGPVSGTVTVKVGPMKGVSSGRD